MKRSTSPWLIMASLGLMTCAGSALASSHREAPFITTHPKVYGSVFYMFRSYEAGRSGYVTLIANYQPLQDPYGGPNYFFMDPQALYEIHIDNNGDGVEDLTFSVPLYRHPSRPRGQCGRQVHSCAADQHWPGQHQQHERAECRRDLHADPGAGRSAPWAGIKITDAESGSSTFAKPLDNIGHKSIPGYATYANSFIHTINIPGCNVPGKVFAGQRMDGFVVNLGETFDLVNIKYPAEELAPPGVNARNDEPNSLADKNVTSLALEIPISCLTNGSDPVIGGWTTASIRQAEVINAAPESDKSVASVGAKADPTDALVAGGAWVQVSRLGAPLVNEVVIGLPDKDRFNGSQPGSDAQFADYVTNPSLPILLQVLFGSAGVVAPNVYPRADLVAVFLTGVPGLNQPQHVTPSEMLRLNTSTPVTPRASQNDLGVIGGDVAGFPNGRRPIDDVVTIALRAAMGILLTPYDGSASDPDPASDASRQLHYTDGAEPNPANYLTVFPYLMTPIAGSPTSPANN